MSITTVPNPHTNVQPHHSPPPQSPSPMSIILTPMPITHTTGLHRPQTNAHHSHHRVPPTYPHTNAHHSHHRAPPSPSNQCPSLTPPGPPITLTPMFITHTTGPPHHPHTTGPPSPTPQGPHHPHTNVNHSHHRALITLTPMSITPHWAPAPY
ncbi:hypothetical protein Pcinc_034823 [Petrolisthes cinctipes]|uniref:Uncharacterized protein n=1 Tax=Petrolisthes cinctipes TaxID=88211 RepID=A0AAE1BZ68_PETCI|nr:hypothetical protein Pcinc_034823 [Petrolisthes cinctipes]